MDALPADRGDIATERRHSESMLLHQMQIPQCVELMIDDHQRVLDALHGATAEISAFIASLVVRMGAGGRLVYVGAGTSGRLGVLDASECPPTFQSEPGQIVGVIAGGDEALRRSSETREDDRRGAEAALTKLGIHAGDTVLGIAAGGTTPYVLGAITIAKSRGAQTGLLTCAPPQTQVEGCDHLIVLDTGAEVLTGSTRLKAGTATKIALNIITTTSFVQLGKVYCNLMVDLRATNDKLADRAIRILQTLCPMLDRESSHAALQLADGELKTAIVMQRLSMSVDEARTALQSTRGLLGPLLDTSSQSC